MNTATHPVAPEEITAYLDGEVSARRAAGVSTHIEECSECQQVADSFQNISRTLASWHVPEVPAAVTTSLKHVIPERVHGRALPSWTRRQWAAGLCISAAAVLVFFALVTPNLIRTRMASSQAIALSRERIAELEKADKDHPVDLARSNSRDSGGYISKLPPGQSNYPGPMIARTVSLSIVAKDFGSSRASLDAILSRHHGYAAHLIADTQQNSARTLQASLRVPAAELTAVVRELKLLGYLENESQGGEEVTQQHTDLVARLKNARETEARLQDILRTRTGKISDVLAVEQEIARVRGEIEQMEAERTTLEHRVDFAAIDLKLSEEYKAQLGSPTPSIPTRFHNAGVAGFRDAVDMLVSIALFFAEYGPSLLIWALLLFPAAWFVWRRWRRQYVLASGA